MTARMTCSIKTMVNPLSRFSVRESPSDLKALSVRQRQRGGNAIALVKKVEAAKQVARAGAGLRDIAIVQ